MYNYQIQDYIDSLNEDYETIINEYSGTELYIEVIHALDWLFPNWKTNAALGEGAPEFVLSVLNHLELSYEENSQLEWLTLLYEELIDFYPKSKFFYTNAFKEQMSNEVSNLSDDEFYDYFDKEPSEMTSAELNNAYQTYRVERLQLSPYSFL